jgi:hypothetical protein
MKNTIKDLLDDMIGKPISEMQVLKDVFEKMEISDTLVVTSRLLFWQKIIIRFDIIPFEGITKDKFVISNQFSLLNYYKPFFEQASLVFHEVFVLEKNEVRLNSTLTEEEIAEIRTYIDENYTIEMQY